MISLTQTFLALRLDAPPPCTRVDPELFFEGSDTEENRWRERRAKEVCRRCPLIKECLEWALQQDDQYAVLGGMTAHERSLAFPKPKTPRKRKPKILKEAA